MNDRPRRDDATIDRLRAGLDELTHGVRAEPPELTRPSHSTGGDGRGDDGGAELILLDPRSPGSETSARRRRPSFAAAAAVAVVIVAAAGTVLWMDRRDDSSLGTVEPTPASPPSSPSASTATASPSDPSDSGNAVPDAAPLPVPDVPDGWDVIEWGDVRLAVPGEWRLTEEGVSGCESVRVGTAVEAFHLMRCGGIALSILPAADDSAEPTGVLNDIPVAELGGDGCAGCLQFLSSPVWGGQVGIGVGDPDTGATDPASLAVADQIRNSITVSGRWRAVNEPLPPVPDDWVEVEHLGVTLSVPRAWTVRQAHPGEIDPDVCGRGMVERTALLDRGVFMVGDPDVEPVCSPIPAVPSAVDGVRIHRADDHARGPSLPDPAIWHVVGGGGEEKVIVRIGIGVDPAVGLAVLNSLDSTTPGPSAGTDAPAMAPGADEQVYRTSGLVLEVADAGPMLCFVPDLSRPPQCTGPRVVGWDWSAVPSDSYESNARTRSGLYVVTGRWDERSRTFTLTEEPRSPTAADLAPPDDASPPAGGSEAGPASGLTEFELDRIAWIVGQDPSIDGAFVDPVAHQVVATVIAPDAALQAEYDERYGQGAIELRPYLRPVETWPS